ncbi:MAG: heparinase II/III family protein, partial [Solirubrobacterales bacterium]
ATAGQVNVYDQPLVQEIGRYIYRVHIADDYFVNFADASAKEHPPAELAYRYGQRIGDDRLAAFGAYLHSRERQRFVGDQTLTLGRFLPEIFHAAELDAAKATAPLARDAWFEGIQVMAARCAEGTSNCYFVAAKGGHNAESHNHNDVGNFIVYVDGRPILIDIGVETYSRKTFSSQRYEIWTMQSAWHNLPTINGLMQSPGRQFAARDVRYEADDDHAQLKLDIAAAYPPEAGLKSWVRTIRLNRGRNVTIVDECALEKPADRIVLSLVTPCKVSESGAGRLLLETVGSGESPVAVQVVFDGDKLKPTLETVPVEDASLRSVWPERLTRILLVAEKPAAQEAWTMQIERARN